MKEKFIEECRVLRQNCTYTAETHYAMANHYRRRALGFQLVPTVIAALSSAGATIWGASEVILVLTLGSSIVAAVATVLNPNRAYQEHLNAARGFTILKHDARFLAEAESTCLSDDAFVERVRNLHEKYSALVASAPATAQKFFEKAREVVQAGIHEPDREAGAIK